eukprot:m.100196 g.100196  ORF g.100196 m.100196 type:complete len:650 (-) comp16777_c0_seq2:156-2105(-)
MSRENDEVTVTHVNKRLVHDGYGSEGYSSTTDNSDEVTVTVNTPVDISIQPDVELKRSRSYLTSIPSGGTQPPAVSATAETSFAAGSLEGPATTSSENRPNLIACNEVRDTELERRESLGHSLVAAARTMNSADSGRISPNRRNRSQTATVTQDDTLDRVAGARIAKLLNGSSKPPFRLVQPKAVHSSKYPKFNVKGKHRRTVFPWVAASKGWWHTIVHAGTMTLLLAVFSAYMVVFLFFTWIYMLISEDCGLQLGENGRSKFSDALYLSVETMTTIGYGVPDPYYNGCGWGFICVIGQSLLGFMMNAVLFGTVFSRVSRAQRRAVSIKFAPTACIREVWGRFFLCIQVVEARQYQVISNTVAMYCALQDKYTDTPYQLHYLRTIRPDDTINNNLLMCIPSTIVHELDTWSPLTPPHKSPYSDGMEDLGSYLHKWPSCSQRFDDSVANNRAAFFCLVCGESYAAESVLRRHAAYNAELEMKSEADDDGTPPDTVCMVCGDEMPWDDLTQHYTDKHANERLTDYVYSANWRKKAGINHANAFNSFGYRHDGYEHVGPHRYSREEIQHWMESTDPEIIILLNSTDVVTGSAFETQASFTLSNIKWDAMAKSCVFPDKKDNKATVDFKLFTETEHCPPVAEGDSAGHIQFHL